MINETIVSRLERLIIDASMEIDMPCARELAEYLAGRSVIAAPVEIGQKVYAFLSAVFTDEEDKIISWEVKGIGLDEKGRLIVFTEDGEHFTLGEESCRLNYSEAEEDLKRFKTEEAEK